MTKVLSRWLRHDKNFCHGNGHRAPHGSPRARARARLRCIRRSPRRVRFSSPDIMSSDRHRSAHCPLFLQISHLPIVTVRSPVFLLSADRPPLTPCPPSHVSAAPLRTTSILTRTYLREVPLCWGAHTRARARARARAPSLYQEKSASGPLLFS